MDSKKIANFLFEVASLRNLIRSHSQVISKANDNVSDHSFRTAIIGMILAKLEGCDENKVLKMCLLHDLVEARTGDANFINKQYVNLKEKQARQDQMKNLPIADEVLELMDEFEKRESKESIIAKDADLLDQMILQQEYFYQDQKNLSAWQTHTERALETASAKKLAEEIKNSNPFEWVYTVVEEKTNEKIQR